MLPFRTPPADPTPAGTRLIPTRGEPVNSSLIPAARLWPVLALLLLPLLSTGCSEPIDDGSFPRLTGDYFGQEPPGAEPRLFGPGWITTGMLTRDVAVMPDGDEIYFCVASAGYRYSAILVTRRRDGVWTQPEVAPFSSNPEWMDLEPAISPDGSRFFFLSNRPVEAGGEAGNSDIWAMDRTAVGWSEPYNLGPPINTEAQEFFPSPTRDGTLYFTRAEQGTRIHHIWRSRPADDGYQEPELLPEQVNCGQNRFNAFVAADESYVIVPAGGLPDTEGGVDYYITFRAADDTWSEPQNLGAPANSADGNEWSAYVTRDGRYLFFMSARQPDRDPAAPLDYGAMLTGHGRPQNGNADIYWMEAGFIEGLRTRPLDEAATEEVGHE